MVVLDTTVTIDRAGRIVLPKPIRDKLHLVAGDTLNLSLDGERLTLTPERISPPLEKERGVWVFRTGQPTTAEELQETLRQLRERELRRSGGDTR